MKYISIQDLIDYGKELRFQSADQMKAVYDRMPGIDIVHCKDCGYSQSATLEISSGIVNEYSLDVMWCNFNDCYIRETDFCSGGKREE